MLIKKNSNKLFHLRHRIEYLLGRELFDDFVRLRIDHPNEEAIGRIMDLKAKSLVGELLDTAVQCVDGLIKRLL